MSKSIFTPSYQFILQTLRQARKKNGLTQLQLAKKLKKTQSFICKIEKSERRLDIVEFLEIAHTLNIDTISLIQKLKDKNLI